MWILLVGLKFANDWSYSDVGIYARCFLNITLQTSHLWTRTLRTLLFARDQTKAIEWETTHDHTTD